MVEDRQTQFTDQPSHPSQNTPTIAFFGSALGGLLSHEKWQLWQGVVEAARQRRIRLLYVAGEEFEFSPDAVLYRLVGAHNVNGLIMWNDFVHPRSTAGKTLEFCNRYYPLPLVSIGLPIEGYPNLSFDHAEGMRRLLAHLVNEHGYQHIAFVGGPDRAARQRYRTYEEIMTGLGAFDLRKVGSLDELDTRGLMPGLDYQAIVVSEDHLALQVVETLQARGVQVPGQVAVTGYSDGQAARAALPPLTTVRLPFREMGRRAMEMLCNILEGKDVPEEVSILPALVVRRSCGCLDPLAERAAAAPVRLSDEPWHRMIMAQRAAILAEMIQDMSAAPQDMAMQWAAQLLDCFMGDLMAFQADGGALPGVEVGFVQKLNEILVAASTEGVNVSRWQEALSILRRRFLPHLSGPILTAAEDLWHQGRVLIGQTSARREVHHNWQITRRVAVLREIEAALFVALDAEQVVETLASGLPRLGIRCCYVSLYEDPLKPEGMARLVLAYSDRERLPLPPEGLLFPANLFIPPSVLPPQNRRELIIESLHFGGEQIGFMCFEPESPEAGFEGMVYDILQTQISSAFKGIRVRHELHRALQQAEEANQLKSRFLSMVSHELRTPLNLMVGLSEMALREQSRPGPVSLEVLKKYQQQIYTSGQHLDRLIRDVLDLASSQVGKMELIYDWVDFRSVLLETAAMGTQLAEQKSLTFQADIAERLPRIWGDKTRLRQILLNLISNAVKFTAHGEVTLSAIWKEQEILVSVRDTGLGIPLDEQEKIFDEFQQSDRTSARGYGGIGLGLAITRRLVEMHGGRIWVTSSGVEGSGSTFTFTLPVVPAGVVEEALPHEDRSGVVLILTESPTGCALAEHLSQQGFLVETWCMEEKPDLVSRLIASPPGAMVLDLAPASEKGWEVMKALKENPATQDIPVLFYSLVAEQNSGAVLEVEYLNKPIGAEALIQALDRFGLRLAEAGVEPMILIVDDEPGILDLHAQLVQQYLPGYRVKTAGDGRTALEIMHRTPPSLVLLDLMMPELDGFGVLKAMQADRELHSVPVIVLSAQVLTEREMTRLAHGVASVLEKGMFTVQETFNHIQSALNRNKRLGSEGQRLVRRAMAYIHQHYRETLSRAQIARYLNINEQYLSRCFNRELDLSPMVYLNRYRIQQAKRLLELGGKSITQVALETGFSNQSYFSRMFQKMVGVSPRAYQRGERPKG